MWGTSNNRLQQECHNSEQVILNERTSPADISRVLGSCANYFSVKNIPMIAFNNIKPQVYELHSGICYIFV